MFEKIPAPWFENGWSSVRLGEDTYFCSKMKQAGFRLYCDLDVLIGHVVQMAVWPSPTPGGYQLHWVLRDSDSAQMATASCRERMLGRVSPVA